MSATKVKNMEVADLDSTERDDPSCLSAQIDDADLWHQRLGNVSSSLWKNMSQGPGPSTVKVEFFNKKVYDAC